MPNQYPNHGWDKERTALLEARWRAGVPASTIARELGDITRNAVIGKARRLGLPPHAHAEAMKASSLRRRASRQDSARARTAVQRIAEARAAEPPKLVSAPLPPEQQETPLVRDLLALDAHHCKCPIGDPQSPHFGFCGRPKDVGSYCAHHDRKAHQPGTATSPNQLAKSIRRYATSGTARNEAA